MPRHGLKVTQVSYLQYPALHCEAPTLSICSAFPQQESRFREPTGANRAAGLLAPFPSAGGAGLLADGSTGGGLTLALCSYGFSADWAVVAGSQLFPRFLRTCFCRIRDLAGA